MRLVRIGLLAAALALAGCSKEIGYDIGACSPGGFMGTHVEISQKILLITKVSRRLGDSLDLPKPVIYTYKNQDAEGRHYVSENMDIVIVKADKKQIVGKLKANGQLVAALFGVASDGSQLADNAKKEFAACIELLGHGEPEQDKAQLN